MTDFERNDRPICVLKMTKELLWTSFSVIKYSFDKIKLTRFVLFRIVLDLLTDANAPHAFKVGEIFILEGLNYHSPDLIVDTLKYWALKKVIWDFSERLIELLENIGLFEVLITFEDSLPSFRVLSENENAFLCISFLAVLMAIYEIQCFEGNHLTRRYASSNLLNVIWGWLTNDAQKLSYLTVLNLLGNQSIYSLQIYPLLIY